MCGAMASCLHLAALVCAKLPLRSRQTRFLLLLPNLNKLLGKV